MIENTKVREIITKEITDNDLNISPDLVIERYGFELIGLKDWNDYRKFSRNWIKMSKLLDKIFAITLKAGTGLKTEGNSFEEGQTFSLKIATKNEIGGVKQGENIEITDDGTINGSAPYRHPSGNGNTHLPSNGATGQFIKWLSAGAGQWTAITWGDITGKPSTFTPSSHTHSKSQITDFAHTHVKAEIADFSHTHDDRYFTEAEILEKFKNFCPYSIGDIYITTLSTNPAVRFLGTTWEKIEGRFLLSTTSSGASGQTGGSNTVTISKTNLPNVKVQVDSFSLSSTNTYISSMRGILGGSSSRGPVTVTAPGESPQLRTGASNGSDEGIRITQSNKSLNTGTASPYTSALGSGTPLDITPAYYTVHIWKRLT